MVERVLWVWLIGLAFTLASIMVRSNLRNTVDNPITVSIETIPVQVNNSVPVGSRYTICDLEGTLDQNAPFS